MGLIYVVFTEEFPFLLILIVNSQMEVAEDLSHELALFIEDIEELGLLAICGHGLYWNSELADNNIG